MVQQFSLHTGIKKFGNKATVSVSKELQQIHDMGTYEPLDTDEMTVAQRAEAIQSLLFISKKRDKQITSRLVADRSV